MQKQVIILLKWKPPAFGFLCGWSGAAGWGGPPRWVPCHVLPPSRAMVLTALVGAANFKRSNPLSDRFESGGFHHVEFVCGDAGACGYRFEAGLGMHLAEVSDTSTGNYERCSRAYKGGEVNFVFTAPYGTGIGKEDEGGERAKLAQFVTKHGTAVRAVCVEVADAHEAFDRFVEGTENNPVVESTKEGVVVTPLDGMSAAVRPPTVLKDERGEVVVAEVRLYGDVLLRFISRKGDGDCKAWTCLPGYAVVPPPASPRKPLVERLDHIVGNVFDLLAHANYIIRGTGFHEFAEFTAEDVGTVDSGLNSVVLANNAEAVLLPINEPTYGTKRKSQILTYLEQNEGCGVQHIALKTPDIVAAVTAMRESGSFEFLAAPDAERYYHDDVPKRMAKYADADGSLGLSPQLMAACEKLGILIDRDDRGILLQIFTRPVSDRATLFLEVIQRVGCMSFDEQRQAETQTPGCGGFGKGNFKALFASVEKHEEAMGVA